MMDPTRAREINAALVAHAMYDMGLRDEDPPSLKGISLEVRPPPKRVKRVDGVVMFPTTHDITPGNVEACREMIRLHLEAGNRLLVVSKPDPAVWLGPDGMLEAIARIRMAPPRVPRDRRVTLRFTIGGLSDYSSDFWEPSAPTFIERRDVLRGACAQGWSTSVSCEPLLEPWRASELVNALAPYVTGEIWIGALNDLKRRVGWRYPRLDEPMIVRLAGWQTPQAMARVMTDLARNVPTKHYAKLRFKDSYQRALRIDSNGRPNGYPLEPASGPRSDDRTAGRDGGQP